MSIPNLIYHYTNIEALINGIINPKVDNHNKDMDICLWATHCEYLNDPVDSYLGDSLLHDNEDIKSMLKMDLTPLLNNLKSSYVISFSESKDCLPMWNMYGKNGMGIKLGFDFKMVICNPKFVDNFYHCVYENTENYHNYCNMIVKKVRKLHEEGLPSEFTDKKYSKDAFLYGLINAYARAIKSQSYEHEREWRIIIPAYINVTPVEFRYNSGLLVPFIKQYLPKISLKEVWIGPTNDMDRSEKSIKMYLDFMGYDEVKIYKSKIPFRQ